MRLRPVGSVGNGVSPLRALGLGFRECSIDGLRHQDLEVRSLQFTNLEELISTECGALPSRTAQVGLGLWGNWLYDPFSNPKP